MARKKTKEQIKHNMSQVRNSDTALKKLLCEELNRNRQISRRIKKHLWLSNRSWARDVHLLAGCRSALRFPLISKQGVTY